MAGKQLAVPAIDLLRTEGTPLQRLLGETLNELGGLSFLAEWAEDYPEQFMRILIMVNPNPVTHQPGASGPTINLNLPAGCGPGPLDVVPGVVADQ